MDAEDEDESDGAEEPRAEDGRHPRADSDPLWITVAWGDRLAS
jgi:hypothetical protein